MVHGNGSHIEVKLERTSRCSNIWSEQIKTSHRGRLAKPKEFCSFGMWAVCAFGFAHLGSQLFHVGVNLIQNVETLLEKSVLRTHERQHLHRLRSILLSFPETLEELYHYAHLKPREINVTFSPHPGFQTSFWPEAH